MARGSGAPRALWASEMRRSNWISLGGLVVALGGLTAARDAPLVTRTSVDPNSGVRVESPYRDGKRDGVERAWYPNGQIMYERRFERGQESGRHLGWYANGVRHFVYDYTRGVLEGEAREWFPNGAAYRLFHYRAGHEEGSQEMWYPSGARRANYVVHDGRRYGLPGSKGCTGSDSSENAESMR